MARSLIEDKANSILVSAWWTLTKWRGLDGVFTSPALKSAIRLAVHDSATARAPSRSPPTGETAVDMHQ